MKKFCISLFSFVLLLICSLSSAFSVSAEETNVNTTKFETYYPYGIEDYIDLNNLSTFTVSDNYFYYTVENETACVLNRYDFANKTHEQLKTYGLSTDQIIKSLRFVNDKLFVLSGTTIQVFDEDNFSSATTNIKINGASAGTNSPYEVHFNENTYTFAFYTSNDNQHTLNIYKYSQLTENSTEEYSLTLSYNIKDMAINDTYVYIVGSDNLFHIYKHTDITTLTEYSNSSSNTPILINTLYDIDAFNYNGGNYFAVTSSYGLNIYDSNYMLKGSANATQVNIALPKLLKVTNTDALSTYIFDSQNCNIQKIQMSFSDGNFTLGTPSIILAGKGSTPGRFEGVNSLTLKNENTLFVSDAENNRIQILNENSIKEIKFENANASNLILDENHNLLFLKHTTAGTYLCGFKYDNGTFETKLFNDIPLSSTTTSMTLSLSGKLYLLDYANKTISVLETYDGTFKSVSLTSVTPNANSEIKYSNTYSEIILSVDNILYRVATDTGSVNTTKIQLSSDLDSFEIDYNNNIYILSNNIVTKTTFEDSSSKHTISIPFTTEVMQLNQDNGNIYLFNEGKSCFEILENKDFSAGLTNFPHQLDQIFNSTAYNSVLKYGTINANKFIYDNVNYVGDFYYTPNSSVLNVIVIQEELSSQYAKFVRVGYVLNDKLNIGYVKAANITISDTASVEGSYNLRTTNKQVSIYKYPTLASNVVVDTLNIGTPVTAIGTYGASIDNNGFYYIVNVNNKIGYIYSGDVVSNTSVSTKLETNAEIRILDHSDAVYLYSEPDENSPKIIIEENQRIYVKDYDKTHTFTLVSYVDSDHVEHVGYVLTKYVKMDGVNSTLITAIILFSLTLVVGIGLLVFYILYKKKQNHSDETTELNVKTNTEEQKSNQNENNENELEE